MDNWKYIEEADPSPTELSWVGLVGRVGGSWVELGVFFRAEVCLFYHFNL